MSISNKLFVCKYLLFKSGKQQCQIFFVYYKGCIDLKPMAKRQWMTKCSVWYLSENDIHYLQINILCIESCAERSGAIQAVTQFPISISTFWHQLNNQLRIKLNINWIKILFQIRIVKKRMIYIYCISLFKSILTILSVWNVTKWKGTNIATFSNLQDWLLTSETNQDFLEVNLAVFRPILNFKSVSCTQILMLNSPTFKQSRIFLKNSFHRGHYCYGWLIDDFDLFLWNLLFSRQTSFFVKKVLNVGSVPFCTL